MTGRLLAVDAPSFWYRAFHGVPDSVVAPDGTPVNAVRGTLDAVASVLTAHPADALVLCEDVDWRPSWRVALLPSYKAQRVADDGGDGAPESLDAQVPVLREVLDALGVARVGAHEAEADDVLAVLAQTWDGPVDVATGDRDLFGLVDDDKPVRVLYTGRGVRHLAVVDDAECRRRHGVPGRLYPGPRGAARRPEDGLPGVPGVGDKTAGALLERFGSLDGVLAAVDDDHRRLPGRRPATAGGGARLPGRRAAGRRAAPRRRRPRPGRRRARRPAAGPRAAGRARRRRAAGPLVDRWALCRRRSSGCSRRWRPPGPAGEREVSAEALLAVGAAVLVGAALQSALGFGGALVMSPVLLAVLEPAEAVTLLVLLGSVTNLLVLVVERRRWHVRGGLLRALLVGALPGLVVGVLLLGVAGRPALQVVVGLVVLTVVVAQLRRRAPVPAGPGPRSSATGPRRSFPVTDRGAVPRAATAAVGVAVGALTTTTGTNGPPMVLWFQHLGLPPEQQRDTLFVAFTASSCLAVPALVVGGSWQVDALGLPGLLVVVCRSRQAGRRAGWCSAGFRNRSSGRPGWRWWACSARSAWCRACAPGSGAATGDRTRRRPVGQSSARAAASPLPAAPPRP